jgi:hypothetical protein
MPSKRRAEGEAEGAYGLAEDPRPEEGGGGQATRDEAIAAGATRLPHAATHARRSSRRASLRTPPVERVAVY